MENIGMGELKVAIRVGITALFAYLVELDFEMFFIWSIVAFLDVIVGVLSALKRGEFRSSKMRDGMVNKILEFFLLLAVVLAQRTVHKLGYDLPAVTFLVGAFIFKDIGSIIETMIENGLNVPSIMKEWFLVGSSYFEVEQEQEQEQIQEEKKKVVVVRKKKE